jgi:hypothetical protein
MRVMHRSGLSNPMNTRWISNSRDLALRIRSALLRLESVVSTAKLTPRLRLVRRSFQNVPSGGNGCRGWIQTIQTEGNGIGIQQPFASLEIDGSRERGLSGAVRACDYREDGHAALGGVRRQFTDNFVVFSGRGAWQPADFESSAIGPLHHIEAFAVDIEGRKPSRKRLGEGFAARCPHGIVKLGAPEIVGGSHT